MADAAPSVMKSFPLFRDELPRIFPGRECELQDPESVPLSNFTVWSGKAKQIVASPSRPRHDFSNSVRGIGFAFWVLRRETFIGMFMSGKNQVGVGSVQVFPKRLQLRMYGMSFEYAAAEESVVPIR